MGIGAWVLSILLGLPLCRCFSTSPQLTRQQSSALHTNLPTRLLRSSALQLGNMTDSDGDWSIVSDQGLLISDVLAAIVACQLLGLHDALDNPTFWANGGWFQPPTVPSSLPILVSRISVNSLCWIAASLPLSGYKVKGSSSDVIANGFQISAGFVSFRLLVAFCIASGQANDMGTMQILRECYFVSLAVVGARYTYHQLFQTR